MRNIWPSLLISALILSACSSPEPVPEAMRVPPDMNRILVVSFRNAAKDSGDSPGVRCPLSGKIFVAGGVASGAEAVLDAHLRKILKKHDQFKFISPEQIQGIQSGLHPPGEGDERRILMETGRKLGADAVLAGHIYRFKDRVGGNLSVESPASVAFDLHFLRVSDGRLLWSNHFDETQKALTDDLFQISSFLKRDGQWVRAEEMAVAGLDNVMEAFTLP